jgi:hypothetical protein
LVGGKRILKAASHLELDFMDQRMQVANLLFDFSRGTKEGTEFPRSPPDERGLILAFEMVPASTRLFQSLQGSRTIGRGLIA